VEARAGDRQVLESLLDELHDLVSHGRGLDELGPLLIEREEPILKRAHPEEPVLLLEHLDRSTVDRAHESPRELARLRRHEVAAALVLLAADAVVALKLA